MSTLARICLSLAVFLALAGSIYGFTSHEFGGTALLLVAAATFCFLGLVSRRESRQEDEAASEAPPHVGPTIWPFGFAISAVILALGLIVSTWLMIAGAIVFAISAAGWLRDVAHSRTHAGHP